MLGWIPACAGMTLGPRQEAAEPAPAKAGDNDCVTSVINPYQRCIRLSPRGASMNKTEHSAPNIVLIVTDQQRWDTLGCLGYDHVITPHIDRLAARGVAFSRAFVQGAVCGPSRNSIVSGQYVHTHGIDRNEAWLTPEQPNWIEQLRDGGYHTVNIGKMHTAPIRLPCGFRHRTVVENKNYRQGHHGPDPDDYDLYLMQFGLRRPALTYYRDVPNWPDYLGAAVWPHDEALFIDNCIGCWSVEAIRTHDFAKPLFLWSGFAGPHDPFDAPESSLARYEGVDIPGPVGVPNELDTKPPPQRQAMEGMDGKHPDSRHFRPSYEPQGANSL